MTPPRRRWFSEQSEPRSPRHPLRTLGAVLYAFALFFLMLVVWMAILYFDPPRAGTPPSDVAARKADSLDFIITLTAIAVATSFLGYFVRRRWSGPATN